MAATLGRGHSSSLGRAAQQKAILPNRSVPKSLRTLRHGQRQVSEDKVPKDRRRSLRTVRVLQRKASASGMEDLRRACRPLICRRPRQKRQGLKNSNHPCVYGSSLRPAFSHMRSGILGPLAESAESRPISGVSRLDSKTVILLIPAGAFVIGVLVWLWTNKL